VKTATIICDNTLKFVKIIISFAIMKRIIFAVLCVVFCHVCELSGQELCDMPVFRDRNLPAEMRARDIVSRLTLEEKTLLMMADSKEVPRLGIKRYNWWNEALHGVARNGHATVFPQPIAMASSFDPELVRDIFEAVSDEGRVKWNMIKHGRDEEMIFKGLTFWTPNVNIFRDPRWGRGMETYGEDPYLTSMVGMEVVRGIQGPREDGTIKAQACAKHYAVHSGPEWARHTFDAKVSERDLWETYLPAFKDLVTKADVDEVMFSFNRINGEPAGASSRFLTDILKKEWGFDGVVVSDCWAVNDIYAGHKWVETQTEAVAAAVKAGMILECGDAMFRLPEAVAEGLVTEAEIDSCLVKLFEIRYRLGEMDDDSPWDAVPYETLNSEKHADLAYKMARETMVLLKNDGILPLSPDTKVALMGPNAADSVMMWGNYNGVPVKTETLLMAMEKSVDDLKYVPGCPFVTGIYEGELAADGFSISVHYDPSVKEIDYNSFVEAAEGYETVIFAGGISPRLEGEEMKVDAPGFRGGDRTSIELPEVQKKLIKALHDAGKKIILVNFSGSVMAFADEAEYCDAIVQAWYPGQEGGTAVADVLMGRYNPSGKLPLTFYADDSQLKDFEDYDMDGRTYRFFEGKPLYPFGHGLSYTGFKLGKGKVVTSSDGSKEFVVSVKNTGKRDGDNVIQLYISRPDDAEGPLKTLRGFSRVSLKAGEKKTVRIPVDDETFLWWNPDTGRMDPMPGDYILHYGDSSADDHLQTIEYTHM